jgi:hypothetical protein
MRVPVALLAGIVGAVAGASGLGFLLAWILTAIYGPFEGSAAMGGFMIGMPLGAVVGFGLGLWLVLRSGTLSTGRALAWLAGLIVLLTVAGAYFWEYA